MPAGPLGRPAAVAVAVLLPLGPLSCGIIRSTTGIDQARRALDEATGSQAAVSAPYEYTLAQEYLAKAREEQAYNDYQAAENLALRSKELAQQAALLSAQGPRKGTENLMDRKSLEVLPEQGEVEQQREQQEQEQKVLQTGPTKVLDEDEVDLVEDKDKKDKKDEGDKEEDVKKGDGKKGDGEKGGGQGGGP